MNLAEYLGILIPMVVGTGFLYREIRKGKKESRERRIQFERKSK